MSLTPADMDFVGLKSQAAREIARYGGLSINMPRYAIFFLFFTMASIGLPHEYQPDLRRSLDDAFTAG